MLTFVWEYLNDIISNSLHMFTIPVNKFSEYLQDNKK